MSVGYPEAIPQHVAEEPEAAGVAEHEKGRSRGCHRRRRARSSDPLNHMARRNRLSVSGTPASMARKPKAKSPDELVMYWGLEEASEWIRPWGWGYPLQADGVGGAARSSAAATERSTRGTFLQMASFLLSINLLHARLDLGDFQAICDCEYVMSCNSN